MKSRIAPQIVRIAPFAISAAGLLAFAAALLFWSQKLNPPAAAVPAAMGGAAAEADPAVQTVAQWLSATPLRVEVASSGAIVGAYGAVAILRVNGGPPNAYRAGDRLAGNARITAIHPDAVLIDRDGTTLRIPMPMAPAAFNGFVGAGSRK